jgi:2-methylcitrate dehydratase PrpD
MPLPSKAVLVTYKEGNKMGLTQELARFACNLKYEDIPAPVAEKMKTCVLHAICTGLAGYELESVKIARNIALTNSNSENKEATVIGAGRKASVMDAAFAGTVMCLSRVQGDTHGVTHTGPISVPIALALAEKEQKSGRELLTALVAAYEIMAAVGKDYTKLSTERGFRASGIYGIFGVATVSGLLLGLDEEQMTHALGLASSFAFSTSESLVQGTMEWRYQEGVAIHSGLLAVQLAKGGVRAAPTALEGVKGFYRAFTGETEGFERIIKNLGKEWETLNVLIKLFPTCIQNNSHVYNVLRMKEEIEINTDDIQSIQVEMNEFEADYPGHKNWGPFVSQGQTLNSVPFCVSMALLESRLRYDDLLRFTDPTIQKLVEIVSVEGQKDINPLCSRITVKMKSGEVHTRSMDVTSEFYNLSFQADIELIRSMIDELPITSQQVEELIEVATKMETLKTIDSLVKLTAIKP